MPVIFISYRRKDAGGHAGRLQEALARQYGRDAVFMDIDSLQGGVNFRQRIHEALDASDTTLVLIGDEWTGRIDTGEANRRIDREDDLVRQEVAAALEREDVAVVPVLVEDAALPAASELPESLSSLGELHVCRLRNSEWGSDLRRLFAAIDASDRPGFPQRLALGLRRHRSRVAGVAALILTILLGVVAAHLLSSDGGGEGCSNEDIAVDARAKLAEAAASSHPAEEGSVYYGSCGSKAYALASFPNGADGVFARDGLHWVDLGPIVAEKCARVPPELLEVWGKDDC